MNSTYRLPRATSSTACVFRVWSAHRLRCWVTHTPTPTLAAQIITRNSRDSGVSKRGTHLSHRRCWCQPAQPAKRQRITHGAGRASILSIHFSLRFQPPSLLNGPPLQRFIQSVPLAFDRAVGTAPPKLTDLRRVYARGMHASVFLHLRRVNEKHHALSVVCATHEGQL